MACMVCLRRRTFLGCNRLEFPFLAGPALFLEAYMTGINVPIAHLPQRRLSKSFTVCELRKSADSIKVFLSCLAQGAYRENLRWREAMQSYPNGLVKGDFVRVSYGLWRGYNSFFVFQMQHTNKFKA